MSKRDLATISVALSHAFAKTEYSENIRPAKLRSSRLPYCPLLDWHNLLKFPEECRPELRDGNLYEQRSMDLSGKLYTSMGTIVHEVMQDWIPATASKIRVLAKWNPNGCAEKACPFKNNDILELDNTGCSECGKFPLHEEIDFDTLSTGHIDQIWVIGVGKNCYILDIKTTSLGQIWAHQAAVNYDPKKLVRGKKSKTPPVSPFPQPTYVHQIGAYAIRMRKKLKAMGYRLKGTAFLYIPRDRPSSYAVVPAHQELDKEWYSQEESRLNRASKGWQILTERLKQNDLGLDTGKLMEKNRVCDTKDYYEESIRPCWECPLSGVCFDDKERKSIVKRLSKLAAKHDGTTQKKPVVSIVKDVPMQVKTYTGGVRL